MEIQAAIGSNQIDSIDSFIIRRRKIAKRVAVSLSNGNLSIIGAETLANDERSHSWMLIPLLIKGLNAPERRRLIVQKLEEMGIETRPILTGNFLSQPAIQRITRHAVDPGRFIVATKITNEAFMVGAHHDLTDEQVDYLCDCLKSVSKI